MRGGHDYDSTESEKTLSLALAAALLTGLLAGTAGAAFTDAQNITHAQAVNDLVTLNVLSGKPDGSFDPTGSVTARECSKMLLIAAGYEADKEGFTGAGWADAVDTLAKDLGLYVGLDSGRAEENLSRDEAAQMVDNVRPVQVVNYWKEIDGKLTPVDRYELGEDFLEHHFGKEFINGKLADIPRPEPSYEPIVLPPHK